MLKKLIKSYIFLVVLIVFFDTICTIGFQEIVDNNPLWAVIGLYFILICTNVLATMHIINFIKKNKK